MTRCNTTTWRVSSSLVIRELNDTSKFRPESMFCHSFCIIFGQSIPYDSDPHLKINAALHSLRLELHGLTGPKSMELRSHPQL